jgi:hypothetical protein
LAAWAFACCLAGSTRLRGFSSSRRPAGGWEPGSCAVEDAARSQGLTRVRLDTRSDLTEAWRLYASNGYQPAAPFNDGRWADLWFEKSLA